MSSTEPLDYIECDHADFARWPEYQRIAKSLDDFVQRCQAEEIEMTQLEWEAMITAIVRNLPARDGSEYIDEDSAYPYRMVKQDRGRRLSWRATYHIPGKRDWTTYYGCRLAATMAS